MSTVSFTRKPGEPFRFSPEERERLGLFNEADIERNAQTDPDNPPADGARLRRMQLAREIKRVRTGTGLSQPQFAARFRIGLGRLRDLEQARSEPDMLVRVFYRLIDEDPARAEALVAEIEAAA